MDRKLIDIIKYEGEGYKPLIDFQTWRVAYLRYCEELELHNLKTMQKHNETDEVFVLLAGSCTLFTGGSEDEITEIDGVEMEPYQLYNVKKGVWHTHTVARDGIVLIVENRDTSDVNSPTLRLDEEQRNKIMEWGASRS